MKTAFGVMEKYLLRKMEDIEFEYIDMEIGEQAKKDAEGKPTDEKEAYTKITVDVPRGVKELSRLRIDVKVLGVKEGLPSREELEDLNAVVRFSGLEISFVDSRKNIYFRAKDFEVEVEE